MRAHVLSSFVLPLLLAAGALGQSPGNRTYVGQDIFVAASQQVHVLIDAGVNKGLQASSNSASTSARVPVSFNVDSAPLAVLAMPQKINGERDLVILSAGHSSASLAVLSSSRSRARLAASNARNCTNGGAAMSC